MVALFLALAVRWVGVGSAELVLCLRVSVAFSDGAKALKPGKLGETGETGSQWSWGGGCTSLFTDAVLLHTT